MKAKIVTTFSILAIVFSSASFAARDLLEPDQFVRKQGNLTLACAKLLSKKLVANSAEEAYSAVLRYEDYMNTWASNFPDLEMIPLSKIKSKKDISNRSDPNGAHYGLMNAGLLSGLYDDTKVFIKKIHPVYDDSSLARQAQYTLLLDALFIGPHFIGIATDRGVPVGLVTEYLEGQHFHHTALEDSDRVNRIADFLLKVGIRPGDLQFIETQDGRLWIVDNGRFKPTQRTLLNLRAFKSAWTKVLIDTHYSKE